MIKIDVAHPSDTDKGGFMGSSNSDWQMPASPPETEYSGTDITGVPIEELTGKIT
ncbi:MAG TPA: hypothetical protein PLU21_01330 [Candidatus Saccharibacteria bacterium]|nr:hypothetical protein [Candidatus Saccharibacteria bacterium]